MGIKVFLAFSEADAGVAGVLRRLIEYHGLETAEIPDDPKQVNAAEREVLVVVLPGGAGIEPGLAESVERFRAGRERAEVVALRFGPESGGEEAERSAFFLKFDFDERGLDNLFWLLGRRFLERPALESDSSGAASRRKADRRTGPRDRRIWNVRRFRTGFWLAYDRSTGAGKFDPLPLTVNTRTKVLEALRNEMERYLFEDSVAGGHPLPEVILSEALEEVLGNGEEKPIHAIHMIESIAQYVWTRYSPKPIDRRLGIERRSAPGAS